MSFVSHHMPNCAYCKQDRPMTREHIVPAFMYEFQRELESKVIGWNEVAEKMIPGEFKVKDVCEECNSGPLSKLDSYGKELLTKIGILVPNFDRLSLTLSYDYDPLLRWLLKVSFNSSRTDGAHRHLFEEFSAYMLGSGNRPTRNKVAVLAYLASPQLISGDLLKRDPYARLVGRSSRFNPFLVRICYGGVPGATGYTLRLNIFGPLVFYLLMFDPGVLPGHASAAIRQLLRISRGTVEIHPKRKVVELHAGPKTWLDLYQYQVARARALGG